MNPSEPERRSLLDEDAPPTDWSYVSTVEEGIRQQQAKNIGEKKDQPRIRHRVDPNVPKQEAGPEVARSVSPVIPEDSPFAVPGRRQEAAPAEAPAAEAAKPAEAPQSEQKPARTRRRTQIVTEDGSHFEKPAEIQIPEWLQVARQNVTPEAVRRPPAPRVQPAVQQEEPAAARPLYGYAPKPQPRPQRQADLYAAAGYPEELLEEQRKLDAQQELQQLRKRRGAMSVLPEEGERSPARSGNVSYPPPRSGMPQRRPLSAAEQAARARAAEQYRRTPAAQEEQSPYTVTAEDLAEESRIRFPWLGVLTSLVLLLAVFLWLNRITTAKELEKVYLARQQAAQQVVDEHPYRYRELIEAQAEQYNLHPAFVASIVLNESSFRPGVKSSANAMGLMQIRPDTGTYVNRALDIPGYNHDMLYDPETNIRFGCYYLGELSRRFGGDPVLVASAYNAGPTNVQNWLNNSLYSADRRTIPLDNIPYGDTQTYARRVLRDFAAYKRLYYEEGEL